MSEPSTVVPVVNQMDVERKTMAWWVFEVALFFEVFDLRKIWEKRSMMSEHHYSSFVLNRTSVFLRE